MNKSQITILIDESGTLPDPKDKVIIIAAVGTEMPAKLIEITQKIRKKLKARKKKEIISEIKFYNASEKTKTEFLKELSKCPIDIFILIVNKNGQKIPDTPENFALLCYLLLEECFLFYQEDIKEIIFDKHFHKKQDLEIFNRTLQKLLDKKVLLKHVDSEKDIIVDNADMVAGSALWAYTGKSDKFYKIIKNRIISEKILNWKEAKRKFLEKLKNLTRTSASAHPK